MKMQKRFISFAKFYSSSFYNRCYQPRKFKNFINLLNRCIISDRIITGRVITKIDNQRFKNIETVNFFLRAKEALESF